MAVARPFLLVIGVLTLFSGLLLITLTTRRNLSTESTIFPQKFSVSSLPIVASPKKNISIGSRKRDQFRYYDGEFLPKSTAPNDPYFLHPGVVSKQYSISPSPCSSLSTIPFLVLIVFSRPDGRPLRTAIRNTWGSFADPHCGVRLLFMFGRVYDTKVQSILDEEAKKYGDVIQSNQFDDKYRAAATKAVHLLQWGATFCPESTYTAKIDDDNWLNLGKYLKFLRQNQDPVTVYGGIFGSGTTVIRDPNSKYYVPKEEFGGEYYPEYLSGILYAFPTKQLAKVVHVAKNTQTTFNDDVFVCGIVTTKAGLRRKEVPDYAWDHNIADTTCPKRDKMCIHYSKIEDFYRLWNDPCFKYEKLC